MSTIYKTKEWKGYGKQNYYSNKYELEGDTVSKSKCHRFKSFDGDENSWNEEEKLETSWKTDDEDLPEWLKKYL